MQRLTYINLAGERLVFGGAPPYTLASIKGTGATDTKVTVSRGALQHGETPRGVLREPRHIDVTFNIHADTREEMYRLRKRVADIMATHKSFDGQRSATVQYENDYGTWWTWALPDDGAVCDARVQDWMRACKVSFRCGHPFWMSMTQHWAHISPPTGEGLRLPFRFPVRFQSLLFAATLNNEGSAYAPVYIEITGGGEKPRIMNSTTGALIELAHVLSPNEILTINTDPTDLRVQLLDRETRKVIGRADGYLTLESVLSAFALAPGVNLIEYTPSTPSAASAVTLYWYDRLEGV